MMKKFLRFLGLCEQEAEVLPPYIGRPIDADTLKRMREGVVAIANRSNGMISIAIRRVDGGFYGLVMENGHFFPDAELDYESYGKPGGWQAYEVAPFEPFQIMHKGDDDGQ